MDSFTEDGEGFAFKNDTIDVGRYETNKHGRGLHLSAGEPAGARNERDELMKQYEGGHLSKSGIENDELWVMIDDHTPGIGDGVGNRDTAMGGTPNDVGSKFCKKELMIDDDDIRFHEPILNGRPQKNVTGMSRILPNRQKNCGVHPKSQRFCPMVWQEKKTKPHAPMCLLMEAIVEELNLSARDIARIETRWRLKLFLARTQRSVKKRKFSSLLS